MALKGPRVILETDITRTCSDVAEKGVGLVAGTAGSGVALGDLAGTASLATNPSGNKFVGILIGDVVSVDETRTHRNWHKDVQTTGERVNILRKGRVTTDKISGSPNDMDTAYLTTSGAFTPTLSSGGGLVATPKAGTFVGKKDENGFCTIDINLPN